MNSFKTVIETFQIENNVKKSRFIGIIFPCDCEEAFINKLNQIKKEYSDAKHHCYAYRIKDSMVYERYHDDKEPSKTAGVPILDVLKGQELLQCAIVVVRYFGGVLLGTGGLSRAYSDCARDVVKEAQIVSKEVVEYYSISIHYNHTGKIEYYLKNEHIPILGVEYEEEVKYKIAIRLESVESYLNEIGEITNGQGVIASLGSYIGYYSDDKFIEG